MSFTTTLVPRFVSVWDGGTEIETACTIDRSTGVVTPELAGNDIGDLVQTFDSQRVMLGEFSVDLVEEGGVIRVARLNELPVLDVFAASLQELPEYVGLDSFFEQSGNPNANTKIRYQYRDGANYKKYEEVILEGAITPDQIKVISESFFKEFENDGHDFLPRQVGLSQLCPWTDDESYDDDIDHMIHTVDNISLVNEPANANISVTDLVNKFAAAQADGWDIVKYGNSLWP